MFSTLCHSVTRRRESKTFNINVISTFITTVNQCLIDIRLQVTIATTTVVIKAKEAENFHLYLLLLTNTRIDRVEEVM